jgi:hypothetical protein
LQGSELMTTSYMLSPIPLWYLVDNVGQPLGGAKMYTYRNTNKTVEKAVYQDAAGSLEYTNPILFNANGSRGPFYWADDEAYYIEIYSSDNVLIDTIPNYTPPAGGGGGGGSTTNIDTKDYLINNLFWRNCGTTNITALPAPDKTNFVLAPGCHAGFVDISTATNGAVGSDIRFIKSNSNVTDAVSFPVFAPGSNPLTGDITPPWYFSYQCSAINVAGESYKYIQFPISSNVKNLDNVVLTYKLYAKADAARDITLSIRQYYGEGGGSADVLTTNTLSLSTTWEVYTGQIIVPAAIGTVGTAGNSGVFFQIGLTLNTVCTIDIATPSLYVGTITPGQDIDTFDMIDGVINVPRTGDIQTSLRAIAPGGFVAMNDGSIGNPASNATTRSNNDTLPLFKLLWDNVSNSYAPVQDSTGTPVARGATAVADFIANRKILLTKTVGRVLASSGQATLASSITASGTSSLAIVDASSFYTGVPVILTGTMPAGLSLATTYYVIYINATTIQLASTLANAVAGTAVAVTGSSTFTATITYSNWSLGQFIGEESHALITTEIPSHTHSFKGGQGTSGPANFPTVLANDMNTTSAGIGNTGGSAAHNNLQPTSFVNYFIKL